MSMSLAYRSLLLGDEPEAGKTVAPGKESR